MPENKDTEPKLHIDADWKASAKAEKERLAEKEKAQQAAGGEGGRELPEATMKTLIDVLASQAIMGLGGFADPKTGKAVVDLDGAKFSIDLLGVLGEKTEGNLTDEESTHLTQINNELRSRFVQIVQLIQQQGGAGAGAGAPGPEEGGGPSIQSP